MDLATLSSLAEQLAPLVLQKIKGKGKKEVSELTTVNDYENVKSLPAWYWNKQTGEKKAVNVSMADFQQHVKDVANQNLVEIKQQAEEANAAAQNSAESAAASAASAKASEDAALAQKNETVDYLNTVKANENERISNENERKTNEDTRKSNEIARANQENTRIANEEERKQNETARQSAETSRAEAETTREQNEQSRIATESERQDAETTREGNEATRIENESARGQNETARQEAETLRENSESGRANSEAERELAEQARISAEETRIANEEERTTWFTNIKSSVSDWFSTAKLDWTSWFEGVKSLWSSLKTEVIEATDSAVDAADNANNMANHPPYVGDDLYWYVWNNTTKTYDKTDKYSKGDGFSIKKTFPSVAEMEAYVNPGTATTENPILKSGDFVIISSNAEDEDNSKLYVVQSVTSDKISYGFLTDMSGARGFAGHTPQLSIGTITTGEAGTSANVSLAENGTDDNGNPKYLINFVIPKGEKGDKGDAFTYNDFTDEQIAGLQKPAKDAAAVALSAADTANNKATLADNAATNANEKAELANTAATDANNAAAKANDAAAKVNSAITDTEAAATKANEAAESANDAAAKANAAVDGFNWDNLKDKPSSFTPSAHTHAISEVTNLQATLDGKAAASHTHAIADITNISSASVNYASSAGNSDTCDGLHVHGGRNNEANKIVRTDGNGYIQCGYINSSSGDEGNNSSPARVWGTNGSDSYLRTYRTSALSVKYASSAGNADTLDGNHASAFASASHSHSYIPTSASCNKNWSWSGQGGQPSWLWGSNDGSNCYVWNPSNFSVNYASSAGNADTLDGYHYNSFAWASHSHSYLSLGGGTMSGTLSFNAAGPEHIEMRTTTSNACAFSMGFTNGKAWSIGCRSGGDYGIWFYNTIRNIDSHIFYPGGSLTIKGSLSQSSDMRLKNVLSDMQLNVNSIAQAPLFQFTYTYDSGNRHVGTSAQYWDAVYSDYFTKDDGKYLSIEYQNLSVAMGISLAREIVKYESKTDEKVRLMKEKINELEKANESLEARVKELEERMTA